jgi:hypothetical protein
MEKRGIPMMTRISCIAILIAFAGIPHADGSRKGAAPSPSARATKGKQPDNDKNQVPTPPAPASVGADEKQPTGPVSGTVTDISVADLTVKLAPAEGGQQERVYYITIFTDVFIEGKPAKIEEIQKGQKITVVAPDNQNILRIDAEKWVPPPPTAKPPPKKKR